MQRGGAVGKQGGGIVNLVSRMMPGTNHNFYDQNFFVRQGRKGKGGTIIVVNNTSTGGAGGGNMHACRCQHQVITKLLVSVHQPQLITLTLPKHITDTSEVLGPNV